MSFTITICIGWCQPGGPQWTDTVAYDFRIYLNRCQHTNGEVAPPIRRGSKHSGEEWDDFLRELFAFQPASPGGRDVLLKSERKIMSIRRSNNFPSWYSTKNTFNIPLTWARPVAVQPPDQLAQSATQAPQSTLKCSVQYSLLVTVQH